MGDVLTSVDAVCCAAACANFKEVSGSFSTERSCFTGKPVAICPVTAADCLSAAGEAIGLAEVLFTMELLSGEMEDCNPACRFELDGAFGETAEPDEELSTV